MTTRDDVIERLTLASAHPWGPARSNLTAEAVTWADALQDEELEVDARLALTEAYHQGNEEWKALAPFAWLLSRCDERPDLFDADRLRRMSWNYKWAVPVASDNPGVGVAQLRSLEAGLEEFFRAQGASMHAVHGDRLHAAIMLGLEEEGAAELAAWRSTPRDASSDCEGCDPMRQVEWASLHEDWETAVAAAAPVLRGEIGCAAQPHTMQGIALLALLASGRPRAAWEAHVRSYRILRAAPQALDYMSNHLEYLALSGRVARGLRILREFAGRTGEAESARVLMDFLAGAALVLREADRAGRGAEPLGVDIPAASVWCPGPGVSAGTRLSDARGQVEQWAGRIAGRYDERNGNTIVSQRLEASLARRPLTDEVEVSRRGPLAGAGAELIEPAEELPRPRAREADDVVASRTRTAQDGAPDTGPEGRFVSGAGSRTGASAGPAAPAEEDSGTGREGDRPYPVVDLRTPPVAADADELLRRLDAGLRRPGKSLEYGRLVAQAISQGIVPDPGRVPPDLARAARLLRYAVADCSWDYERAADELALLRTRIDGDIHPLPLLRLDLEALQVEGGADELHDRSTPRTRADRLARAGLLAGRLAALTEPLLDAPEEHRTELVDVYEAATALVRILLGLQDHEGAAASIELAWRVAPYVADMAAPGNGTLCDQVTLLQADMLLERGDVYGACALADAVLRRYDPCPVVLAEDARSVLVRASMKVGENEEAVTQARELLNIHLAAGMGPLAGLLFGTLAAALGAAGRSLEAAEVLETALESGMPPIIVDELRRTLVFVLDQLDESKGVRDNCLAVAEASLERGQVERGVDYLLRAASACESLEENTRAARLLERAAELVDVGDDDGRVRRSRYLRSAARAVVDERTALMSRTRLAESRSLMSRARDLISAVPDSGQYSSAFELGDWHDDMAWILWRAGESGEALGHCEDAFAGYMSIEDRGSAAQPLTLMALIHTEAGDTRAARSAIARVRELLSHRRWGAHPALARVASLEEVLDGV